jgi:hypothetical protein
MISRDYPFISPLNTTAGCPLGTPCVVLPTDKWKMCSVVIYVQGALVFSSYEGGLQATEGYAGRISLVSPDTSYGKGSINLTNIRESDGGWYECSVFFPNRTPSTRPNGTWFHLSVEGNRVRVVTSRVCYHSTYIFFRFWMDGYRVRVALHTGDDTERRDRMISILAHYSEGPVLKFRPGERLSWLQSFVVFLSHLRQRPKLKLNSGRDRFLAHSLQCVIQGLFYSCHSTDNSEYGDICTKGMVALQRNRLGLPFDIFHINYQLWLKHQPNVT